MRGEIRQKLPAGRKDFIDQTMEFDGTREIKLLQGHEAP